MDKNDFMKAARILKKGDLREARNFAAILDSDPRDYLLSMMDGLRQKNPTATRVPERKRTKLIQNGERKKNPRVRYADIAGPSVAEFKTVYAVHLAGQPSMNAMAYFTTKKNAVDTAQFLADETGKQVKVTRIQIAFN